MSATNPETGTVSYLYNAAHQMTQRTDAKAQQTRWLYDAFGRLQQVQHYTAGGSEIPKQRVTYYYDVNPFVSNWSDNALGRMAAVEFWGENGDEQFTYMYGYNEAGRVTKQRLRSMPGWTNPTFDLDAAYSWDNEGRMTSMTAPGDPNGLTGPDQSSTPPTYTFGFDSMGRTNSMTGPVPGTSTPGQYGGATYGIAGELLTLNGISSTQSFTYNILGQLTQISAPGMVTLQYEYIAGQNNGRISKAKELISGEEVTYTYDSLNRLTLAETPNGMGAWGQAFTYDGFGNLTSKTATKGTGVPTMSATFDPSTNRQTAVPYDANGNPAVADTCGVVGTCPTYPYDVENRLLRTGFNAGAYSYSYDPAGKRIWKQEDMCTDVQHQSTSLCELYFYDIQGRRMATYAFGFTQSGSNWGFWYTLRSRNVDVVTDRLGSVRAKSNGERFSYYPYGEERTPSVNGRDKFATYFRDEDGVDYADQRYYDSGMGRFRTADPGGTNSAIITAPWSWNRFTYVGSDPVNFIDETGERRVCVGPADDRTCWEEPDDQPIAGPGKGRMMPIQHPRGDGAGPGPSLGGVKHGGGGPGGGVSTPDCPSIPDHPRLANVDVNIKAANDYSKLVSADFYDSPSMRRSSSLIQKLIWLYDHVKNGAAYDYKQDKSGNYEDFGNFNFGAVGAALGIDLDTLLKGAGFAQRRAGTSKDSWGTPLGHAPFGDDPRDQEQIRNGFTYFEAKAKGCI